MGKSKIDEIFAGKKRKQIESERTKKDTTAKPKMVKKKKVASKVHDDDDGGFGDSSSKPRKKSAGGITINTRADTTKNKPQDDSTSSMEKPQDYPTSSEKSKENGGMGKIIRLDHAQKLAEKWVSQTQYPDEEDDFPDLETYGNDSRRGLGYPKDMEPGVRTDQDIGKRIATIKFHPATDSANFSFADPSFVTVLIGEGNEYDDAEKPPGTDPKTVDGSEDDRDDIETPWRGDKESSDAEKLSEGGSDDAGTAWGIDYVKSEW